MLVRRFPYRTQLGLEQQLRQMERLMDAMLDRAGSDEGSGSDERQNSSMMNPSTDVYRNDDELVIEIEIPGVDVENDLQIDIDDNVLTIQGQRTSTRSSDDAGSYVTERRTGRFSRSLSLPDGVDPDQVEADYTDGVLKICVPIPDEEDRGPRRVEIGTDDRRSRTIGTGTSDDNEESQGGTNDGSSGDDSSDDKSEQSTSGSAKKSSTKAAKKSSSGTTKKSSTRAAKKSSSGSSKKSSGGSSAKAKTSNKKSKAKGGS